MLTFQSPPVTLRTARFNTQELYMVITLPVCVLYGSENKYQPSPYTSFIDWIYNWGGECLQRGTDWIHI